MSDGRAIQGSEDATLRCDQLEADLAELRGAYEQYFMGNERLPPVKKHDALKKKYLKLKNSLVRQTAAKFRIESIGQRILTYERLWDRTLKEIEAGTYKRDLAKLRRRGFSSSEQKKTKKATEPDFDVDEDLDLGDLDIDAALSSAFAEVEALSSPPMPMRLAPASVPTPKPAPRPVVAPVPLSAVMTPRPAPMQNGAKLPTPALTPMRTPTPVPAGGLSETRIKAIYEAYVMAKKRCGEDTRSLTLDSVAKSLKQQVPELMRQHNAKAVEFRVVIKDGKAVLRALPKD